MSWLIHIADQAQKSLKRLPKSSAGKILLVLEDIIEDPYFGDIRKVKGEIDTWRRRVGEYRITYVVLVNEKLIKVTDIERKSDHTYR
ncbi:MAG: type II toxin-antitoxin system RelE/ParE family toxin [Patescibacteria group bacterium]